MSRHQHISRLATPRTWPVKRKGIKWIAKSDPGPHSLNYSMPLIIYLRDTLGLASRSTNIVKILNEGHIYVNGKVRREKRFPVGLFDTISIPALKKYYRVILNKRGRLSLIEISENEARILLLKVSDKITVKKGKLQIIFNNGWNVLVEKTEYKKGDVLLFNTKENKITSHIKLEKGNLAYIIGGKHTGSIAPLQDITETGRLKKERVAVLAPAPKKLWKTSLDHIFVIGTKEPVIKLQ